MPLSTFEREEFFSQPHIATLSVSMEAHMAPLSVPIWYYYVPNEEFWFSTGTSSAKARAIYKTKSLSLVTQISSPLKYVTAEATVTSTEKTTPKQAYALSQRYITDPVVAQEFAHHVILDKRTSHTTFHLVPTRWLSAQLNYNF